MQKCERRGNARKNGISAGRYLKCYFAVHYFHGMTGNADVYDLVTLLVGAHKDLALAFDLNALLDERLLSWRNHAVFDGPGDARACRRAGCRVLSVVKRHTGLESRGGIQRLARNKIK